jgi:hypothetical protein
MQVYEGLFSDWGSVVCAFEVRGLPEPTYVWAEYDTGNWEGWSTVITSDDGDTFVVAEGSHCSCYGLEGQWDPTAHTREEMEFMYANRPDIAAWLKEVPHGR